MECERARAPRCAGAEIAISRTGSHYRHRARSLHEPWPGWSHRRDRLCDQRRNGGCAVASGAVSCGSGRGHGGAVGHDGRAHRRNPRGARRQPVSAHAHPRVLGQIRVVVLRAVSRRGRVERDTRRRQQIYISDGPGQFGRSVARGPARPRRGRRHGDGQARPALPRHPAPREGHVRRADGGVSGVRASTRC